MRTLVVGSLVVIGVYLVMSNATGAGKLLTAGFSGAAQYAKTLQGR